MTGISKFQICCYKIGVFSSGFAWEIHLISKSSLRGVCACVSFK